MCLSVFRKSANEQRLNASIFIEYFQLLNGIYSETSIQQVLYSYLSNALHVKEKESFSLANFPCVPKTTTTKHKSKNINGYSVVLFLNVFIPRNVFEQPIYIYIYSIFSSCVQKIRMHMEFDTLWRKKQLFLFISVLNNFFSLFFLLRTFSYWNKN